MSVGKCGCRNQLVWLCHVETPQFGSVRFACAKENRAPTRVTDFDSQFSEGGHATFIAELADAYQIVGEPRHDVPLAGSI